MELTWINKLRIAAVAALGILVLGLMAWPLVAPADPLTCVRASNITFSGTMLLLVLAFGLGFAGYFIAWPHGREIGILAVPFGLAVWAGRSGPMSVLTQACRQPEERAALASSLRFEPLYWLLLVAAGFAGVLLAQHLRRASPASDGLPAVPEDENVDDADADPKSDSHDWGAQAYALLPPSVRAVLPSSVLTAALGVIASVVLAHFFVGVFAQDVATSRNAAPTQPLTGQIIFAVIGAFAVAAFVLKKFANLGYVWPAFGSALLLPFAQALCCHGQTLRQFAETRPATFFPHSALTILPVQFVALGTLGSILGYWIAVRYDWWRKHESAG